MGEEEFDDTAMDDLVTDDSPELSGAVDLQGDVVLVRSDDYLKKGWRNGNWKGRFRTSISS